MKHQEKYILKYDGSIEEYLKQMAASQKNPAIIINYHNRINKLAIQLTTKFPSCKNVNFVEISKIALELFQKRKRDDVVRDMARNTNNEFSGSFELQNYLNGIKSSVIVSQDITIKYLEPIESGSKRMKLRKLVIDGSFLVRLIEQGLVDMFENEGLKRDLPKEVTKVSVFVDSELREDHLESQYAKVACKEITALLKSYTLEDDLLKEIAIHALENVDLIERYPYYVARRTVEQEKDDSIDINERTLWVSRAYTSLMR
jgi:hypothetical protein